MKIYGSEITPEQIAAGLAAMQGEFRAFAVQAAIERAGVTDGGTAMRAADRLIQRERKAGRIRVTANKRIWERAE